MVQSFGGLIAYLQCHVLNISRLSWLLQLELTYLFIYLSIYLVDNCFEKNDNVCMKYVACTFAYKYNVLEAKRQ